MKTLIQYKKRAGLGRKQRPSEEPSILVHKLEPPLLENLDARLPVADCRVSELLPGIILDSTFEAVQELSED